MFVSENEEIQKVFATSFLLQWVRSKYFSYLHIKNIGISSGNNAIIDYIFTYEYLNYNYFFPCILFV